MQSMLHFSARVIEEQEQSERRSWNAVLDHWQAVSMKEIHAAAR